MINNIPFLLLIPYVVLLVIYLAFEQKRNFRVATSLKLCLSLFFTATAALGILTSYMREEWLLPTVILIAIGLFFSIFGDYYLQYIKKDLPKYKKGIMFFAITQVFYIAALYLIYPGGFIRYIIMVALLAVALLLMKKQSWDTASHMKHLTVYTILLALMCGSAVEIALHDPSLWIIALGGVLFFISDMILGIWNYHSGKMQLAHLNWITYFIGQIFIAFGVWALLA